MNFEKLSMRMQNKTSIHEALDELEINDIKNLQLIVDGWTKELKIAQDILHDYAEIKLSDEDLKTILKNNLDSAYEIYSKSLQDTCVCSVFINQVLSYFNLNKWPCFGDSKEYKDKWKMDFDKAILEKKFEKIKITHN